MGLSSFANSSPTPETTHIVHFADFYTVVPQQVIGGGDMNTGHSSMIRFWKWPIMAASPQSTSGTE
jgi:hypothetical protein